MKRNELTVLDDAINRLSSEVLTSTGSEYNQACKNLDELIRLRYEGEKIMQKDREIRSTERIAWLKAVTEILVKAGAVAFAFALVKEVMDWENDGHISNYMMSAVVKSILEVFKPKL
jgi:hypothetical protein